MDHRARSGLDTPAHASVKAAKRTLASHGEARYARRTQWLSAPLLIVAMPFSPRLHGARVAAAIAFGLAAAGSPQPDLCPIEVPAKDGGRDGDRFVLDERIPSFETRMKAARAVVIVVSRLDEHTLLGSLPFEVATKARQSGVPAYAVAKENALTLFDARILDLQAVIEARSEKSLTAAGRTLAAIV